MDFRSEDTQVERARAFARGEAAVSAAFRDRESRWDAGLFRRMGEAGLLGATVPVADGGAGLGAAALSQLFEGFGEGGLDAGLSLSWAKHTLGCAMPLAWFGDAAQRASYLPALCRGESLGALAHAEAPAAGDPVGLRARALRRGGGFVLHGAKTWVVNAAVADLFLVTAATEPERGKEGVSAFLIERATPGLVVGPALQTLGMRGAGVATLTLGDCYVPASQLLGAESTGLTGTYARIQRWERALLGAAWVGATRALLGRAVAHARERHELGRPLAQSQAIRARLVEMKIRLELGSRLSARAAWLLERAPDKADREAASARLFIARSAAETTSDALSIFGVEGDAMAERLHRDAMVFERLDGGADRLRSVLAGALLGLG